MFRLKSHDVAVAKTRVEPCDFVDAIRASSVVLSAFANGTIFGERYGSTPPKIVALHGWRNTHAHMTKVAQEFDAVSLDLPGFGASPEPTELWGAHDYARAVASVIREVGAPVVLVGHSFGGRVAVCLTADYPELVSGLVLTGVPLIRHAPKGNPPLKFRLVKLLNKVGLLSDERLEAEKRKRGSEDYRAATGLMRDIFVKLVNEDYSEELQKIKVPVEMVWGSEDNTSGNLKQAEEGAALIENVNLEVIEGGTHFLPTENPEPIIKAIRKLVP